MIRQGANDPVALILLEDVSAATELQVQLSQHLGSTDTVLKCWSLGDVQISGRVVLCPITQEESAAFPAGRGELSARWLFAGSDRVHTSGILPVIIGREPNTAKLGEDGPVYVSALELDPDKLPDPAPVLQTAVSSALVVLQGGGTVSADSIAAALGYTPADAAALTAEAARAAEQETALEAALTAEAVRAAGKEAALETALTAEVTRAAGAEATLDEALQTEQAGLQSLTGRVAALEGSTGISADMRTTLWALLEKAAYTTEDAAELAEAFRTAWGISDTGITISVSGGVMTIAGFTASTVKQTGSTLAIS